MLLTHDALIVPSSSCTAHLHRAVLLILTLVRIVSSNTRLLENIWRRGSLQFAITHVLRLARAGIRLLLLGLNIGGGLLEDFVEVESSSGDPFLFLHLSVVELDQVLQFSHHKWSIVRMLSTRIVRKPENAQVGQA